MYFDFPTTLKCPDSKDAEELAVDAKVSSLKLPFACICRQENSLCGKTESGMKASK
jgi:hypothetical protein